MAHIYQIKLGVLPYGGSTLRSKKGPGEEYIIGTVEHKDAKHQDYSYNRSELDYKGRDNPPPMSDDEFVDNYRKYMNPKPEETRETILSYKGENKGKMVAHLRDKMKEDSNRKLIIG